MQNVRLVTACIKFHQICILIGSFCWKNIKLQLKKYRRVMSHDTEEWCKIRSKTDMLLQKWQEFGEFWPKHSEVSKMCTLICSFSRRYMTFDFKKYTGVILHDTDEWYEMWRKTDKWFGKWHEKFGKLSLEHLKVSKSGLWWDPSIQSRKWELKI